MRIPGSPAVFGIQGMGKTEGLQCGVRPDIENPGSPSVLGTQGMG